jgi:uncharacterized protein
MDLATAVRAIDWLLHQCKEAGRCHVNFFGGEPLLSLDLIGHVVRYAREQARAREIEISFGVTTNGTLLSKKTLQFLLQEDIGIMVSVDGCPSDHDALRVFPNGRGTYETVARNVREACSARPDRVHLRATMTSRNVAIDEIAEHLTEMGASAVTVAPVIEPPDSVRAIRDEHLPELKRHLEVLAQRELKAIARGRELPYPRFKRLMEQLLDPRTREYGCGAGKTFFGVTPDGSITFCSSLAGVPEYRMGHVSTGIDRAVQERLNRDLHVDNRESCHTCWARYLCGGGCAHDAHVVNKDSRKPNPVSCERTRFIYELAMALCLQLREEHPEAFEALCAASSDTSVAR